MKRQQKLTKNLQQEKQGRQNKKNSCMTKMRASFKSSPRYEEVKKGDRIRKKAKARKINFDGDNKVQRFEFKVPVFKEPIISGLYNICVVYNRNLYKRSVVLFHRDKYSVISDDVFRHVTSLDGKSYICKTCGKKLKQNCIPYQAVCNMLEVSELPEEFRDIRRLERVLIARRLLFKKISIMPKCQSPKLKGALCYVPRDAVDVCKRLTRRADSNGIVIVRLKRKLQCRGHVYFQSVRPNFIMRLLQYLK